MGRRLHGARSSSRKGVARPDGVAARDGVREGTHINIPIAILIWLMIYPMMLKIDFGSILSVGRRPEGPPHHRRRELAREAVLDGVLRLALLPASLPAADRPRAGEPIHRRRDHSGRCALHGDGVRLVVSLGRRPGIHAGAGIGERSHHARCLRADREVPHRRRGRVWKCPSACCSTPSRSSSSSLWSSGRSVGPS